MRPKKKPQVQRQTGVVVTLRLSGRRFNSSSLQIFGGNDFVLHDKSTDS